MKERDFAIYDKEKKTNIFNHDTLYNLHLCVDHFEWLHDKNSNIPNGFFRPTVEKLTEDEEKGGWSSLTILTRKDVQGLVGYCLCPPPITLVNHFQI